MGPYENWKHYEIQRQETSLAPHQAEALSLLFILFGLSVPSLQSEHVISYLQQYIDDKVSPCDDFYAHVCPDLEEIDTVSHKLHKEYNEILKNSQDPYFEKAKQLEDQIHISTVIYEASINASCNSSEQMRSELIELFELAPTKDCPEIAKDVNDIFNSRLRYYNFMFGSFINFPKAVVFDQTPQAEINFHSTMELSEHFKAVAKIEFEATPWIKNHHGVDAFLKVVDDISVELFHSIKENERSIMKNAIAEYFSCYEKYSNRIYDVGFTCFLISSTRSYGKQELTERLLYVTAFQSVDNAATNSSEIYIPDLFQISSTSKYLPVSYGLFGTVFGHEFMHTFYLSAKDLSANNSLSSYWTDSSGCVAEQSNKTCHQFVGETCPDTAFTNEEDGADIAGIRLAYKAYKEELNRSENKTESPLSNITNDQLFFYAMASQWCKKSKERISVSKKDEHSLGYVRVNAMVAQMKEWRDAFQCSDDSPMVKSKIEKDCYIFGQQASQTKKKISKYQPRQRYSIE